MHIIFQVNLVDVGAAFESVCRRASPLVRVVSLEYYYRLLIMVDRSTGQDPKGNEPHGHSTLSKAQTSFACLSYYSLERHSEGF